MLRCRAVLCCAVMCCDVLCCVVLCTEELYDHTGDDSTDMDKYENENLASSQPGVAAQLHAQVRAFFEPRENKTYPHSTGVVDRSDPYDN